MADDTQVTTEEPTGPQKEAIPEDLARLLGDGLVEGYVLDGTLWLTVQADAVPETLRVLRDEVQPPYEHLSDICGADMPEGLQVVYHLFRLMTAEPAVVKVNLPREKPSVPTVTHLWKMAGWAEREFMEMYGIEVIGHPDPRKLLLPEDWEGFPLRKDYVYPMDHPYLKPDPLREDPASILEAEKAAQQPAAEPEEDSGDKPVAQEE